MDQIPAKNQRHLLFGIALGALDDFRHQPQIVVPRLRIDLREASFKVTAFNLGPRLSVDLVERVILPVEIIELFGARGEKKASLENLHLATHFERISGRYNVGVLHVRLLQQIFDRVAGSSFDGALVHGASEHEIGTEDERSRDGIRRPDAAGGANADWKPIAMFLGQLIAEPEDHW